MIVTIEGGDQSGKKTQTVLLAKALEKRKISTTTFSFPDYDTPIGKVILRYLKRKQEFPSQVIHCLMSANRWEKLDEISDAITKNSVVIMNRYYHSNLIYGLANGLRRRYLESLDMGLPESDLVILLDVVADESFRRKKIRRDRFEEDYEFAQKILKNYRAAAKKHRWKTVDATKPAQQVHRDVLEIFLKYHEKKLS